MTPRFCVLLAWLAAAALADASSLPPAEDTYTVRGRLTAAAGAAASLPVDATHDALLRFEVTDLPAADSGGVRAARLRLYLPRVLRPGAGLEVHAAHGDWQERLPGPAPVAEPVAAAAFPAASLASKAFVTADVTELVRAWLADPASNDGLLVTAASGASVFLGAKEGPGSGYPAELEVEWVLSTQVSLPPDATLAGTTTGSFAGDGSRLTKLNPAALTGASAFGQSLLAQASPLTLRQALAAPEPRLSFSQLAHRAADTQAAPLRFNLTGDSVMVKKTSALRSSLVQAFGYAGYGLGELSLAPSNGATATSLDTADYTVWPTGIYGTLPAGGTIECKLDGQAPVFGDTLKLYYVQEPGAGLLKVQLSQDHGAYYDAPGFTGVSAAGPLSGKVLTISPGTGAAWSLRVIGLSGKTKIIGAAVYYAQRRGALISLTARDGLDMSRAIAANPAIVNPIMADVSPDVTFYEMKDIAADITAYLDTYRSLSGTAATDWVLIGTTPEGPAIDPGDLVTTQNNATLRQYAAAHRLCYWDGQSPFADGATAMANGMLEADGVHPTYAGDNQLVGLMMAQLGLWNFDYSFGPERLVTFDPQTDGIRFEAASVGQNFALQLVPPADRVGSLQFYTPGGGSRGGLLSPPDGKGHYNLFLAVGNRPQVNLQWTGLTSIGENPPDATQAYLEVHNANPYVPNLLLQTPVTPARADFLQCRTSDGTVLARLGSDGGFLGPVHAQSLSLPAPAAPPANPTTPVGWLEIKVGEESLRVPVYK